MKIRPLDQNALERVTATAKALGIDAAALAGAGLIVYGIDLIHRPTAMIVAGLLLLGLSLLVARRG
jgi:hypothetical protein